MTTQYSSATIANAFLQRYGKSGDIDHLKLQKLVYYAYGWWLTKNPDKPLTSDGPEIWKYGPVFLDIYQLFSFQGRDRLGLVSDGRGDE